jgi:AP-3 complex subunit sigma
MILAALVMNTQGKPRITKFYVPLGVEKQQEAIRTIYSGVHIHVVCCRRDLVCTSPHLS